MPLKNPKSNVVEVLAKNRKKMATLEFLQGRINTN